MNSYLTHLRVSFCGSHGGHVSTVRARSLRKAIAAAKAKARSELLHVLCVDSCVEVSRPYRVRLSVSAGIGRTGYEASVRAVSKQDATSQAYEQARGDGWFVHEVESCQEVEVRHGS